jgi:acyl carrier protein phosphodiesterase
LNHLAHFFLSGKNKYVLLGNFSADFINNKDLKTIDKSLLMGIHLHKRIDSFTDSHPIVKHSTKLLHPYHHKYAPVLVDIFYDYFLAKNWVKYSNEPVQDFVGYVYDTVMSHVLLLPDKLSTKLPNMVEHNWLMGYTNYDGLEIVFEKISQITHFPGNFENATEHLILHESEMGHHFDEFFPALLANIKDYFDENELTFEV